MPFLQEASDLAGTNPAPTPRGCGKGPTGPSYLQKTPPRVTAAPQSQTITLRRSSPRTLCLYSQQIPLTPRPVPQPDGRVTSRGAGRGASNPFLPPLFFFFNFSPFPPPSHQLPGEGRAVKEEPVARRLRYSPPCAEGSGSVETEVCPMARPGGAPPSRRPPGAQPPPPPRLQPGDGDRDRDGDRGRAARRRAGGGWSRSGGGGGVPAAAPHAAGARLRAGRRLRRRAHRGPRPRHRLGPAGALPEAGPAAPGQPALRRGKKGHWDQPKGEGVGQRGIV